MAVGTIRNEVAAAIRVLLRPIGVPTAIFRTGLAGTSGQNEGHEHNDVQMPKATRAVSQQRFSHRKPRTFSPRMY
jgi:hypothetical protein